MQEQPSPPIFWTCEGVEWAILASMVKFPPENQRRSLSYEELVCTEEDQGFIRELVQTLGEEGKISLLLKITYMRRLGALICHVHPLKFLATIFKEHHLQQCILMIMNDNFKRTEFMDGLGGSLSRETEKGTLEFYLSDFVKEIPGPVNLDEVQAICRGRNWEKLIYYLLEHV